jgi:lysophospholipase L1-like esterase
MKILKLFSVLVVMTGAAGILSSQQTIDNSLAKSVIPWRVDTKFSGTCKFGEMMTRSDLTVGESVYTCGPTNNWVQSGGGGNGTGGVYCNATGAATNTLVCNGSPVPTSYVAGMNVSLKVDGSNTGAATLSISGLGTKNILTAGVVLPPGALVVGTGTGNTYSLSYDGTQFNIVSVGATGATGTAGTTGPNGAAGATGPTGAVAALAAWSTACNPSSDSASAVSCYVPPGTPQLIKFRAALAGTINGVSNTKILFIGDSTTWGSKSLAVAGIPPNGSYPYRSIAALNAIQFGGTSSAVTQGLITPPTNGTTDTRWAPGTWAIPGSGLGFGGNSGYKNVDATALVITPGSLANTYTVYVAAAGGVGTGGFTVQATGGSLTTVLTAAIAADGYTAVTVSALAASTSNTVTITPTSAANWSVDVYAILPSLSTQKSVFISNAGIPSTTSGNWATNTYSVASGSPAAIKFDAPNLCIISLGINDAGAAVAPATLSATDLIPSSSSVSAEVSYIPVIQALAVANNIPYLSMWGRFGGTFQSSIMADTVHPNDLGYVDWSRWFVKILKEF